MYGGYTYIKYYMYEIDPFSYDLLVGNPLAAQPQAYE